MKTFRQYSPKASPLAVAVSLVLIAGATYAAGPSGGAVIGGSNGATVGTSTGGVSATGFSGAGRGGNVSAPAAFGARPGVALSNNAGQHFGNGSFTRGNAVGGMRNAPSSLSLPYRNVPNVGVASPAAARSAGVPSASRPANAWSGTAVNPTVNNNPAASRAVVRSSSRGNAWSGSGFTGQRLDPGAPGSNLPTYNQGNLGNRGRGHRNGNFRLPGRYYYSPYAYGPTYAPYVSYFGGYYGGPYPYYNEVPAADTGYENSAAATVAPQYVEQAPTEAAGEQPDVTQTPQQPAPQRQQQPGANNGGTVPGNGPDSLVEAVQEELVRRGYYGGKVDAMFNADTKEALRKFQTDHHLANTGLINEATLHALQLD